MRIKCVPSKWILEEGLRLDSGPYMSGAIEARKILEDISIPKQFLQELALGGIEGIYHAGRIKRLWVKDPQYGYPFLSSTDILQADLSNLRYISHLSVKENPKLVIHKDWILITRSGSIGRMAYVRDDMDKMACTEDVLRVIPDTKKVFSGYLYAYLGCKYGLPQVTSGTYGAIIQHLESHHIESLPVPRFKSDFEKSIHDLVCKAVNLRTNSSKIIRLEAQKFNELIEDIEVDSDSPFINYVSSASIQSRFDAQYHDPIVASIRSKFSSRENTTIGEFCSRVFLPGIFKRIHIDDPNFGAPYFTGASLFWFEPQPKGILSRSTSLFDQVLLEKSTILVQAFGQDGGLTGRSVWVGNHLDGCTTTHMLVRLNAKDPGLAGYLFAFLQSEAGYRQIACLTYGGSIPHLDENGIATVVMPLMLDDEMRQISKTVIKALDDRDEALSLELEARKLVEKAIEEAV